MAETERLRRFGVHSVMFFSRTTGESIIGKPLEILGDANIDIGGEQAKLFGGSNLFPWASQVIRKNGTITLAIKEISADLIALLNGTTATERTAETGGAVANLAGTANTATNKTGTSIVAAAGLASVTVTSGSEADLKTGIYVIKATDANSIDVYAYTDVDFGEGTNKTIEDDNAKITATPLDIVSTQATALTSYGLTFTGGATTTEFVTGDTAVFVVRKINEGSFRVPIGSSNIEQQEFGVMICGARQGNGNIEYWYFHKCSTPGGAFSMPETDYGSVEITLDALFDSAKQEVGFYDFLIKDA